MQQLSAAHQGGRAAATIYAVLECQVRLTNRLHQLVADYGQRTGRELASFVFLQLRDTRFGAHRMSARSLLLELALP